MSFSNSWVAKAVTAKGQLHCHSTNSDGTKTPAQVVQAYLDDDYDFVCLTDHDVVTADPAVGGITFIGGDECNSPSCHLGCVGVTEVPSGPSTNQAIAQVDAAGGFTQINHPDYTSYVISQATLNTFVGFDAIEYVNGFVDHGATCYPNNPVMPIPQYKCDRLWSMGGRFWITAGDDCHDHADATCQEQNNVWVMVNAASTSAANIVSELKAGNFYISDGALIDDITVSGNNITITLPASSTVTWQVPGPRIAQTDTSVTEATYTAKPNEDTYILIKVVNGASKRAWAQPIFNDGPPIMLSHAGYFAQPNATGSQAITGVGFRPRAVIMFGESSAGWTVSYCLSTSINSDHGLAAVGGADWNAQATSVTDRSHTLTSYVVNYTGTIYGNGAITNFDADGFTINWTVSSTDQRVYYLALGGTALTNASVVNHSQKTSTGSLAVTGAGFQPDALFSIGEASQADAPYNEATSAYFVGACDTDLNQWSQYVVAQDAQATSNTARHQRTNRAFLGTGSTTSVAYSASVTSLDADGFTCSWDVSDGGARRFHTLCLKGGEYLVGNFAKSTNTSVPVTQTITTTGMLPRAVFETNICYTALTGNGVDGLRQVIGVSDGTRNYFTAIQSKDNSADTVSYSRYSATQSLEVCDNDAHTDDAGGTMGNFVAQAFDAVWATNNNVATEICYMVFGEQYATASVSAVRAQAAAASGVPSVSGEAGVSAVRAQAASAARVPSVSGSAGVSAASAQATATAPAPSPGAGIGITAVKAAATAAAAVPVLVTNNILAAVVAVATATAGVSSISGAAGVAAVNAAATATAPVPVASGAAGVDAVKAEAAATAPVPVLTSDNILSAVAATATADAHAPDVSSEAIIAAVVAAATAVANAPEVSIEVIVDALINAAVATATADAIAPSSISGDAGVDAVSAEAAAEAPAPELISNNIIFAAVAEAVAESEAPSVSGDALVAAAVAEAIAEAYAPEIFNEMSVMIAAAVAEAMAGSIAPTIEGDVWADVLINALVAEAAADAIAPDASGDAGVDAVVAGALADATAPVISGDALIEAIVAEALAEAISPEITEYQGIEIGAVVATATAVAIVPEIFGEIVNVPYCEPEVDFTGTEFLITVLGGVYSEIISMLAQEAGATAFVGSYIDKTDFSASVGAATTIDAIYEDYTHMEGILPAIKLVGFIRCKA